MLEVTVFEPQYLLSIYPDQQEKFACTGIQLAELACSLQSILPSHVWYAADIEPLGLAEDALNLRANFLQKIGSDENLIDLCSGIRQFIWGVFVAVVQRTENQEFSQVKLWTEDEPFRSLKLEGVLLEIRAFDTCQFEVYSENINFLKYIKSKFASKLTSRTAL